MSRHALATRTQFCLVVVAVLAASALVITLCRPDLALQAAARGGAEGVGRIAGQAERMAALARSIQHASVEETGTSVDPVTLNMAGAPSPLGLPENVTIGTRITISNAAEASRTLVVTGMREIGPHLLPASAEHAPLRLVLVTARIENSPTAAPVRFVIEAPRPVLSTDVQHQSL